MRKPLFFCFLLAAGLSARANSLLSSPVPGALGHGKIGAMSFASNGTDVVLLLADQTSLYALDIADNNPAELAANAITSIKDFVDTKLKPVAGGVTLNVIDIEVNPISKAIYVLAESTTGTSYVFKVRNNGSTVTLLNLSSISHTTMKWGGTFQVNDMTWGNNKLYVSAGSFSLDGSVATIPAPFAHGATVTQKATSMFKSNWGGMYVTKAPLETMTYGLVKSKHRLMGVTTCAPGFSLDIASLTGTGPVQVTEDFNVNNGVSKKVVFQRHDGKDWLFDLHDNKVYRIGESLLDGSPVTAGKHNKAALKLRTIIGTPVAGISDDVFRAVAGTYKMIAFWDNYRLLFLETGGTLTMLKVATTAPGLSIENVQAENKLRIYPNPAKNILNVELEESATLTLQVFSIDGRLLQTEKASGKTTALNVSNLPAGQYLLKATDAEGDAGQQIFVVQ